MMRWLWSELGAGRLDVVIRGAGVLVVAGVLAGGGAYVVGGDDEAEANAFIGTTAQTCTRSSTPISYEEAESNGWVCGSMDAANDVLQNGDTALMKGGTYAAQSINGGNSRTSHATIGIAEGETATIDGTMNLSGVEYLTIDGDGDRFGENARLLSGTVGSSENPLVPNNEWLMFVSGRSEEVVIQGIDFGAFGIADSTNVSIRHSDIGPCDAHDGQDSGASGYEGCANNPIQYCEESIPGCGGYNQGHLIEGNLIHGYDCSPSFFNGQGSDDCHHECMYLNYAHSVTIRGNIFRTCSNGGSIFQTFSNGGGEFTADYGYTNYLIENNVFEQPCNNTSYPCGGRLDNAMGFGHCNLYSGDDWSSTVIRYNTFLGGSMIAMADTGCTTATNGLHVYGNLMKWTSGTCASSWTPAPTVEYNLYSGSFTCGTNATNVGATFADEIESDTNGDTGDPHLKSGTNTAVDYVPVSVGCPTHDFEGDVRSTSGSCDAGADERG